MGFGRLFFHLFRSRKGGFHHPGRAFIQLFLTGAILLTPGGCGDVKTSRVGGGSPAGVKVTGEVDDWLRARYYEVQECTGYYDAPFDAIHFVLRAPDFPCPGATATDTCSGQFIPPDTIYVGRWGAVPHELVHYFWTHKTGDPDLEHLSPWLDTCG